MHSNPFGGSGIPDPSIGQVRKYLQFLDRILAEQESSEAAPKLHVPEEPAPTLAPAQPEAVPDLVTLGQAATLVHRRKCSLRNYRDLPPPTCPAAHNGQAHLWEWPVLRAWLERKFGIDLSHYPRFPHL